LRNRRISLILLLLPLLFSCGRFSSISCSCLEGESESTVYLGGRKSVVAIRVPGEYLKSYREYSGTEGEDTFSSLFDKRVENYGLVSDGAYSDREYLMEVLRDVTSSPSALVAYSEHRKGLRKTAFADTLNSLSGTFDDGELAKRISSVKRVESHSLERIIPSIDDWAEAREFLLLWVDEVMRVKDERKD